ncbi:zinc finger BED domain-containing protein RICESLEEPER 2-like protein, partial [Tanacetum coccineum]
VLDANPVHVKALYRRGMAYMEAGDYEEARADFNKMMTIDKSSEANAKAALLKLKQTEQEVEKKARKQFKGLFDKKPGEISEVGLDDKISETTVENTEAQEPLVSSQEEKDIDEDAPPGPPPARMGSFSRLLTGGMDFKENTIHVASTQNNPSNIQEDNQITVDGKQKAECHACKSLLSGESNHGTTHLHDHLKSCKKRKQPDIRERLLVGNSKSNLNTYVYNEKDGRMSLAKMVILHEFLYVPCPHTSAVLTNVLMEALMEWNVDTKLSTITLDNCYTNDKLIDMVKDGAHIHMRCCAHILNLIVKVGLNVIKAPIENVRESISYWTATPKRVEKFEETCRQLKITYSKTLGLDCQTRWNATYLMLKTALMYKDVFTRLKQRDSHYKTLPSPLEWENARVICKKLEVFHNVTAIFSGTRYPTANLYFPKVCDIRLKLNEWLVSPTQLVSNMASKMIEKFDEYWGAIHELMVVAGVFDPRSKMEMIEFYFPQIYPDDSASRIKKVRKICEALILEYQEKTLDREYEFGNNTGSSSANSMEVDENMSAWEKHIMCKSSVPQSCIVMEFDRYLEEGHEPRSPDFDILLWWKL